MYGAGCGHDHERLREALERYERMARLETFLRRFNDTFVRLSARESEKRAHNELALAAAPCGWSYQTDETVLDWSRRRVATFNRQTGAL